MLPAAALSADGPRNLFDAVRVAGDPAAAGRGVLCVAHGRVHAARDVSKQHPARIDAFASGERGPLGFIGAGGLRFTREQPGVEPRPLAALALPSPEMTAPRVELVCSHAGADGELVRALVAASVAGTLRPPLHALVVLGTGGGTVHEGLAAALDQAAEAGVRVQVVPRTGPCEGGDFDGLNAVKVRVRLLLEALVAA
jgi:L-asparaginase